MLYAGGPVGSPYLFDVADPAKFLLGAGGRDLPRTEQGVAMIGDPRDDSHLVALTLHLALLRAHNRIVDLLRADGVREARVFDAARRTLTWHYQWAVLHDFLPRLVGADLAGEVLPTAGDGSRGRRRRGTSRWSSPTPPSATGTRRSGTPTGSPTVRPPCPCAPTWSGSGRCPRAGPLELAQIFDFPVRPPAQRAKRIDGRPAASLIGLPEQVTGALDIPAHRSLAVRDLLRGESTRLPSGEAVARLLGVPPLTGMARLWPGGPRCGSPCSRKPSSAVGVTGWARPAAGSWPKS